MLSDGFNPRRIPEKHERETERERERETERRGCAECVLVTVSAVIGRAGSS